MDLAAKDSYIQKFASKIFSQREQEPKKRPFVHFKGKSYADAPKKKKKCKKKHAKNESSDVKHPKPKQNQSPSPASQKSPATAKLNGSKSQSLNGATTQKPQGVSSFSTVDILRKRLHEKIEESRGQGAPKNAFSEEVKAKRAKRKLDRERQKRKRKDFQMKKLAEKNGQEQPPEIKKEEEEKPAPVPKKRNETAIVFNKVETVEDEYHVDKKDKRKNKKQSLKGNMTPLTGKNVKQLLSRVEAHKAKLEELREKDEDKANELEKKIKWTNMLYKAEGIKIRDDEGMLRTSLKRKEKMKARRKKKWEERSENVIEKMQQRQDKRRRNLQKRKQSKIEKKKSKARKKGRVTPKDLDKAA